MSFSVNIPNTPGEGVPVVGQPANPKPAKVGGPQAAQATGNVFTQLAVRSGGTAQGTIAERFGVGTPGGNNAALLVMSNENAKTIRELQTVKSRVDAINERVGRLTGLALGVQSLGMLFDPNANTGSLIDRIRAAGPGLFASSFDVGTMMQASSRAGVRAAGANIVRGATIGFLAGLGADFVVKPFEFVAKEREDTRRVQANAIEFTGKTLYDAANQEFIHRANLAMGSSRIPELLTKSATLSDLLSTDNIRYATFLTRRQLTDVDQFFEDRTAKLGPVGRFLTRMGTKTVLGALEFGGGTIPDFFTGSLTEEVEKELKRFAESVTPAANVLASDPVMTHSILGTSSPTENIHEVMASGDSRNISGVQRSLVLAFMGDNLSVDERISRMNAAAEGMKLYKENEKEYKQRFNEHIMSRSTSQWLSDRMN